MKKILQVCDAIIIGCVVAIVIGLIMVFASNAIALKVVGFAMAIVFAIFCLIHTHKKLFKETNIIFQLKQADVSGEFIWEIGQIERYYRSLELHKTQFMEYKGNVESMKESYQIIYDRVLLNMKYILEYIKHYDYISGSNTKPVNKRLREIKNLIKKLNELDELYVELDNSIDASNQADIDKVCYLLESLKEITKR